MLVLVYYISVMALLKHKYYPCTDLRVVGHRGAKARTGKYRESFDAALTNNVDG